MGDYQARPNAKENRALWRSTISSFFLGALVISLSLICVSMSRESRWSRLAMASLITNVDDAEMITPVTTDLLVTITFSKLRMAKFRNEKEVDRMISLGKEVKEGKMKQKGMATTKTSGVEEWHDTSIAGSNGSNSTLRSVAKQPMHSDVSWLISFPNSGTTYTIHNTEQMSMRSTATNYAMELHYKGAIVSVRQNEDNVAHGPWQRNNSLSMPPLVLTKTHCAGYDDSASWESSIVTTERFLQGCAESSQYVDRNDTSNHEKKKAQYQHKGLVKSVIHLIRNPFDNVISRMHYGMRSKRKLLGLTREQVHKFMESRNGARLWCEKSDKKFWMGHDIPIETANGNISSTLDFDMNPFLKVPCHSEYFRYVQWHNAALRMVAEENLPSMVLHYEDYETNYNETVDSVLNFLNLSRVGLELPFMTGKTYRDTFFDAETQNGTKELLKTMASKELWAILQKYFPSSTNAEDAKQL